MMTFSRPVAVWAVLLLAVTASTGEAPKEIETKSGVTMVRIPGGTFTMGDADGEVDAPPHEVSVAAFYMDKYEVTQEHYERVMDENPSRWQNPRHPVEQVRWSDAVRYCNARSRLEGLKPAYDVKTWACDFEADGYRLPTEAEWEYAARAGSETPYCFGKDPGQLKAYAWTKETAKRKTKPVGTRRANAWGLHDMYGNVWEWCHDNYAADYYKMSPKENPRGPESGETRVVRGGSWDSSARQCTSAFRYSENPGYTDACFGYDIYGLRVVRRGRASEGGARS